MPITYKDSGVDVERGYKAVELMKKHTQSTFNDCVLGGIGSFGGFFSLADCKNMEHPVLISGADGVGTKLKYAFIANKHDTIGIDAVAMCVNDVVCHGAKPLFFLDYIASSKINPEKTADIVGGMAEGCRQAGCALIGGETAEMPGFYADGEYDIAGFCVGVADKPKVINGASITKDDVLIGIPSSGLHSNGFSLVRRIFGEDEKTVMRHYGELGMSLAECLLTPTKIYVKTILQLITEFEIKGIAHITGGGIIENVPRILPEGIGCKIDVKAFDSPHIFKTLQSLASLTDELAFNTFNMGIGMVLAVDRFVADKVISRLAELGEKARIIGQTCKGSGIKLV